LEVGDVRKRDFVLAEKKESNLLDFFLERNPDKLAFLNFNESRTS